MTAPPTIRYAAFRSDLHDVATAIANRIDRSARDELIQIHAGFPAVLATTVRVAQTTLLAVERLWWNTESGQRVFLEHATAIPPLARTLLDSVFTIVLLFDNPHENVRWFHASGWREAVEMHTRMEQRYLNDPLWQDWLQEHQRMVVDYSCDATANEQAKPSLVEWWPNPGKMTRKRRDGRPFVQDNATRQFLIFLNDWLYGALSGDSHLSYIGMLRRGGVLAERPGNSDIRQKYASDAFLTAVTLAAALLSEVAAGVRLSNDAARLAGIWVHLAQWGTARDLADRRYATLLAGTAAGSI